MRFHPLLLLCTAVSLGASRAPAHPVHISSTQIDLSADRKSLEITVRVFTDDFEQAVSVAGQPVARFNRVAATVVDSLARTYLAPRLRFSVDGAPETSGRLIGHEADGEASLLFIEVPLVAVPRRLSVEQRALLEAFDDQNNIVHVKMGAVKRSALLRRGLERADFTF